MDNHVIIGLGGTGGHIMEQFKRRVYEQFSCNQPQEKDSKVEFRLGYLYVDSTDSDINAARSWRMLGHDISLGSAQCALINSNPTSILNNLSEYDGVRAFISHEEESDMLAMSAVVANKGIAGQRRRFGRILLASSMKTSNADFMSLLRQEVRSVKGQFSGNENVTFHICAGLAGGTGSGTIVDVISQIRHEYKNTASIILYLYVPEERPVYTSAIEYYQANGYAALKELNGIAIRQYAPVDITAQEKDSKGRVLRLNEKDAEVFKGAYVFSRVNEKGIENDIEKQIPHLVGNFLYQKIVCGMCETMLKTERCENGARLAEQEDGQDIRTQKFLSFGLKRIIYPELEIREYAAAAYVKTATMQMYYGWPDGLEYPVEVDEEKIDYTNRIATEDSLSANFGLRKSNCITDVLLTLSKPLPSILDEKGSHYNARATQWVSCHDGWGIDQRFDLISENIKAANPGQYEDWIQKFDVECNTFFDKEFRQLGVVRFFESYKNTIASFSDEICQTIETNLLNDWKDGKMSILEVKRYLMALINRLEERKNVKYPAILKTKNNQLNKSKKEYLEIYDSFNSHSLFDKLTGKRKEDFNKYVVAKKAYFEAKIDIEGYTYATKLLDRVISDLRNNLLPSIQKFAIQLKAIMDKAIEDEKNKCNDFSYDLGAAEVKVYDAKHVRNRVSTYIRAREEQMDFSRQLRDSIIEKLGDQLKFSQFAKCALGDTFDPIALDTAKDRMENDVDANLVKVNIFDLLRRKYSDEQDFKKFVDALYKDAGVLVKFNTDEVGRNGSDNIRKSFQLWMPGDGQIEGERKRFIETLQACNNGGYDFGDKNVTTTSNQSEIVIVTLASNFPVRFLSTLSVLRKKYNELCLDSQRKLALHTESVAYDLPELYPLNEQEVYEQLLPYLMLAYSMNLVEEYADSKTGEKRAIIQLKDENGLNDGEIRLDIHGLFASAEKLSKYGSNDGNKSLSKAIVLKKIKELTCNCLKTEYMHNSAKQQLKTAMTIFMQEHVLPLCGNDTHSPKYMETMDVVRDLFNNELKEI